LQDWWNVPLEFPLTNVLPALSFRLFGLSSLALRAPFILSGIVAPVFVYLALRRVVERPAAWAAAMLLATNRWAALAARFADEIFLPVSIVALAAWLLVRAVQERRQGSVFALALVSSDFFYAYSGYRVLPFIAIAGAAWLAVTRRRRVRGAASMSEIFVLAVGVWVVTLSPGAISSLPGGASSFLEALHRHDAAWAGHDLLAERAAIAVTRLRQGWAVFATQGDELPTLNIPYEPMFDALSAALATLAVLAALWHWRDPSRWLALAMLGIPFVGLALIPVNFNVSRYFVLLVPLFFLIGCLLDDWYRWLTPAPGRPAAGVSSLDRSPRRGASGQDWSLGPAKLVGLLRNPGTLLVGIVVLLAAGLNLATLRRVIDSPIVQGGFLYGENTVLAAIHAVPPGSRVVLLTIDGSVAFEPSDYRWYTVQAHGDRPASLQAALSVPGEQSEPVYWITEGLPEARLLPQLVALTCPNVASRVEETPVPDATVGVSWIAPRAGCHALPAMGLRGVYRTVTPDGGTQEVQQIDPVLCAYTMPWPLLWKLEDRQIRGLQAQWQGRVVGRTPGVYQLRLEIRGARGQLRVGELEARVTAPVETWASASLAVTLDAEPVPLSVQLDAEPGTTPRVRLYWTPPGGMPEELVPPTQLQPAM